MIPVVKVAQLEKQLTFPVQLEAPYNFLHNYFDLPCSGGCIFSLLHCNIDDNKVHFAAMSSYDKAAQSENLWGVFVTEFEKLAVPMYHSMISVCYAIKQKNSKKIHSGLLEVKSGVLQISKFFYAKISHQFINKEVWLQYIQGFEAWGIDEDEGLTGAHILCTNAVDAFCQIKGESAVSHFVKENRDHMTGKMRKFLVSLEQSGLSQYILSIINSTDEDCKKCVELYNDIVHAMYVFRVGHKKRIVQYFDRSCPERMPMTAGGGVISEKNYGVVVEKQVDSIQLFEGRLNRRIEETKNSIIVNTSS